MDNKVIPCEDLEYGQLGEVLNKPEYAGIVITKCWRGFVAVVGNEKHKSFFTMWNEGLSFMVRVLEQHEAVELSN